MEDFHLDLIIGGGPAARSVRIDLPPFTLVGATTRSGLITTPLRERFGIPLRLQFYEPDELELIVSRGARVLGMRLTTDGAAEIARRSRGTPRVAGRLLRRSEEHTSELQSLMRISYAVFCLKKKMNNINTTVIDTTQQQKDTHKQQSTIQN